jgi:3-hydroxymyristoyl/3-hydroxydecanoyl-(acyl carrier protein) dehydratase
MVIAARGLARSAPPDATPLTQDVRIVKLDATEGLSLTAGTTANPANPIFPGHYPGFPIFPGICLIECAHRSVLAAAARMGAVAQLTEISSTRFLSPVFPGEEIVVEAAIRSVGETWSVSAVVSTPGRKAATVRLAYDVSGQPPALEAATSLGVSGANALSLEQITEHLPHRHPMLLVDRVTEVIPGRSLVAVKAVTASEPWFRPAEPSQTVAGILPATVLIESWSQAAGVLATWDNPNPDVLEGEVMLFGALSGVRPCGPVPVGSVIEHRIRLKHAAGSAFVFTGSSVADGRVVLRVGQIIMALRPASILRPAESRS